MADGETHLSKRARYEALGVQGSSVPDPVEILQRWMSSMDKNKPGNVSLHEVEKEYQVAKESFKSLMRTRESLRKSLSQLDNLVKKKRHELQELAENLSPLLYLKGTGVLGDVVGFLDEEALYCLEEASGSIKNTKYAKDQWSYLEKSSDRSRYGSRLVPCARDFGKDAFFARKMEALAHDRALGASDNGIVVKCSGGREKLEFSNLEDVGDWCPDFDGNCILQETFVRLSMHERRSPDEKVREHLVWQGYPEHLDVGNKVDYSMTRAVEEMDWPKLKDIRCFVEAVCSADDENQMQPCEVDETGYTGHTNRMKQLLVGARITIVINGNLVCASMGCQGTERGDGWIEFHFGTTASDENLGRSTTWAAKLKARLNFRFQRGMGRAEFLLFLPVSKHAAR